MAEQLCHYGWDIRPSLDSWNTYQPKPSSGCSSQDEVDKDDDSDYNEYPYDEADEAEDDEDDEEEDDEEEVERQRRRRKSELIRRKKEIEKHARERMFKKIDYQAMLYLMTGKVTDSEFNPMKSPVVTLAISKNSIKTKIENGMFKACKDIERLNFRKLRELEEIGDGAFEGCSGLQEVFLHNKVKKIGDKAFQDCTGLRSITIPSSVNVIGSRAFAGCKNLGSVTFDGTPEEIAWDAFRDTPYGKSKMTKYEWFTEFMTRISGYEKYKLLKGGILGVCRWLEELTCVRSIFFRIAFVLLSLIYFIGVYVYLALWLFRCMARLFSND